MGIERTGEGEYGFGMICPGAEQPAHEIFPQ